MFQGIIQLICPVAMVLVVREVTADHSAFYQKGHQKGVVFLEDLLFESPARSELDCALLCLNRIGCKTFTFTLASQRSETCRGHATVLDYGARNISRPNTNFYYQTTSNGVTDGTIRLVNGNHSSEGRVEVYFNGSWGTVCDDSWSASNAIVVCRQLGYLRDPEQVQSFNRAFFGMGLSEQPILLDQVNCTGQEQTLLSCPAAPLGQSDCGHDEDAGVSCAANATKPIRLVNGSHAREGRVEMFYGGTWGTVCDDLWDINDAIVVCRQLGFLSNPQEVQSFELASFGEGDGDIWLDDVQCTGSETALSGCPATPLGYNNCKHYEDAGVSCAVV